MFDGVRVHPGPGAGRHPPQRARAAQLRARHPQPAAAPERHRHAHPQYVDAIEGTHARVLDTRKTVPGMRALEKYAVLCGGGTNHRIDLASGILIKNNHIALGGGLRAALKRALENRKHHQRIQVEVRTRRSSKKPSNTAQKPSCSTT
jgi:hypothetical protein